MFLSTLFGVPTVKADTTTFRYIQVNLTDEESETLYESSLVYEGITYYGARESADVWRFMIDAEVVDDSLIDLITLYDAEGVPYSFSPNTITEVYPVEEGEPPVVTEPDSSEGVTPPVEPEPVVEEPMTEPTLPKLAVETINIAAVDRAVVGGEISYTFIVENTGDTPMTVTEFSHECVSGDIDHQSIKSFNQHVFDRLYELIGEDGLLPGERVEVTEVLSIPTGYSFDAHPEIGSVFQVTEVDEGITVTRSVDVPVAVKQPVPTKEEPKQDANKQKPEVKTTPPVVKESGAPRVEHIDEADSSTQDVLPMTGEADDAWHAMLGTLLFASGLLLLIRRNHPSTKP